MGKEAFAAIKGWLCEANIFLVGYRFIGDMRWEIYFYEGAIHNSRYIREKVAKTTEVPLSSPRQSPETLNSKSLNPANFKRSQGDWEHFFYYYLSIFAYYVNKNYVKKKMILSRKYLNVPIKFEKLKTLKKFR